MRKAGVVLVVVSSVNSFAKESPFLQVQADLTLLPFGVELQFCLLLLKWWYSDLPSTFNSTWSFFLINHDKLG